jgi:phosphate transport system protein
MTEHTVKSYDDELQRLKTTIAQMGGLAEEQLANAMDALSRRDTALADRVIAADIRIDELEDSIEDRAVIVIAKRQPMANDLREIMVAVRVASDLERIGDLAKNLAKRTLAIPETQPRKVISGLARMSVLAQ